MKTIALMLVIVLVAGCTSLPTRTAPIPSSRLFAAQTQENDDAVVTIVRDSAIAFFLNRYRVFIDDALVAEISIGEQGTFYVRPGEHLLEIRPSDGVPILSPLGDSETLQAKAGTRYYYRIDTGHQVNLLRTTDPSIAMGQ